MGKLETQLTKFSTPATLYTREVGFVVSVDADTEWIGTSTMPIEGTTYGDTPIQPKVAADTLDASGVALSTYVCMKIESGAGKWSFYFGKSKTALEALTPFKVADSHVGNQPWAPTLLKVDAVRMKMPRGANLGNRVVRGYVYQGIPTYHPAMDTGTLFMLRQYLTPNQPVVTQSQAPPPQLSAVSFPLPGADRAFHFPECYHPTIHVNIMREVADVYDTVGLTTTSAVGSQGPFEFKATDPPFPAPFILYTRPTKLSTGAYLLDEMEVIPPNLPPAVTGL